VRNEISLRSDVHKIIFFLQQPLTESKEWFSQTRQMRTAAATYRSSSLKILRGPGSGGTHFVRCIRTDLTRQPKGFQNEVVRQQLRALAVLDTAEARQKGYPHRIPFHEFIHRYGKKKGLHASVVG
jgi:myosin-3